MFLGLFKKRVKLVKIKKKAKKSIKSKSKKEKTKKPKAKIKVSRLKKKRFPAKKTGKVKKVTVKKGISRTKKTIAQEQEVGKVTHYFPHVKAGVILLSSGTISLGDILHIKGHTTDFKQKINSMQINNVAIEQARPGQEIGLLVKSRVRHNDVVYK